MVHGRHLTAIGRVLELGDAHSHLWGFEDARRLFAGGPPHGLHDFPRRRFRFPDLCATS
ncbi:hypothetical protein AGR1C_Cc10359 [Agrobacterium fabacearum TT111]|nr:hypothetical protein AGR1C_Cc10359 [Agrobacterium fabacearum TT111]